MNIPMIRHDEQSDRDARIRIAQEAAVKRMTAEPKLARSQTATTGVVRDGLICHIRQGKFEAISDLGRGMGGDAEGPSPSFYARAAIAGCVAMAVKMHAANEGRAFRQVEVCVETDMHDLALFGLGGVSAAPLHTEISIEIETDEAPDVVAEIVDTALARDPWFLALRDAQSVATKLSQTRSGGAGAATGHQDRERSA